MRRKKKSCFNTCPWKIRCKGKSLTEKRGSLKYVPMLKLKTQLMSPPPTIKNTKKSNMLPHVWSRLSLKGLKVWENPLLSNRKRILVLEKKTLLLTQRQAFYVSKRFFFPKKNPFRYTKRGKKFNPTRFSDPRPPNCG